MDKDDVFNFINNFTSDIIRAFKIQIPIQDIKSVVEQLGGKVEFSDFSNCSLNGGLKKEGDSFVILAPPHQTQEQLNCIIAHELGHLFLHMGYMVHKELWEKQKDNKPYHSENYKKEYQANEFAAAFLMPKYIYKDIMDKYTDGDIVHTAMIAKEFHVSNNAASARGKRLGYLQWEY